MHREASDHILNGESANFAGFDFMSAHIELAHEVGDTSPASKESHVRLDKDFVTSITSLTKWLRLPNDCACKTTAQCAYEANISTYCIPNFLKTNG